MEAETQGIFSFRPSFRASLFSPLAALILSTVVPFFLARLNNVSPATTTWVPPPELLEAAGLGFGLAAGALAVLGFGFGLAEAVLEEGFELLPLDFVAGLLEVMVGFGAGLGFGLLSEDEDSDGFS